MRERDVSIGELVTEVRSVPYDIDGCRDGLGRHAGVLIAGLIAKMGLDQMIAGRGHDARLDGKFASVDVELGAGVDGQGEINSGRVDGRFKAYT